MRSWLVVFIALLVFAGSAPAPAQQLLSGLTASQCAARGGQITTWTNTAGSGPNVGDCYVAPRTSGGGGFNLGGGGGRAGAALSALGAGLGFLDALGSLLENVPSDDSDDDAPREEPRYDYTQTPEYQAELRARAAHSASMDSDTDDLKALVQAGPRAKQPTEADRCSGYARTPVGLTQCYQATAAVLEKQAANCTGSCRATMLRAAASARCVAAVGPSPGTVSATIAKCGKDPASGLQRVAATVPPAAAVPPPASDSACRYGTISSALGVAGALCLTESLSQAQCVSAEVGGLWTPAVPGTSSTAKCSYPPTKVPAKPPSATTAARPAQVPAAPANVAAIELPQSDDAKPDAPAANPPAPRVLPRIVKGKPASSPRRDITGAGSTIVKAYPTGLQPPAPNGACNWGQAKQNVDWVFNDGSARGTFQFNRGQGMPPFEALLASQAHDHAAQQAIANCRGQATAYLMGLGAAAGPQDLSTAPLGGANNTCTCFSILPNNATDFFGKPRYTILNACAGLVVKARVRFDDARAGQSWWSDEMLLPGGGNDGFSAPDWPILSIRDLAVRDAGWRLECHFDP